MGAVVAVAVAVAVVAVAVAEAGVSPLHKSTAPPPPTPISKASAETHLLSRPTQGVASKAAAADEGARASVAVAIAHI